MDLEEEVNLSAFFDASLLHSLRLHVELTRSAYTVSFPRDFPHVLLSVGGQSAFMLA